MNVLRDQSRFRQIGAWMSNDKRGGWMSKDNESKGSDRESSAKQTEERRKQPHSPSKARRLKRFVIEFGHLIPIPPKPPKP
jgi:hypothetical protein